MIKLSIFNIDNLKDDKYIILESKDGLKLYMNETIITNEKGEQI